MGRNRFHYMCTVKIAESYRKSLGGIASNEENRHTNDLVKIVAEQYNGRNICERGMKRVKKYS
ncbi:MAG TPA: hypothetical protein VFJ51_11190 [Nitrososphaeraceae archaeon]|nr:hypothetical protein [Nitrososphaeraceae archaeon]